jgi:hypothetical protein
MLDTALMIAAFGLGCAGSHWLAAILVGVLLTALSSSKQIDRVRRYNDVGPTRVLALGVGATLANNIAFAAMAFALGRVAAWLLVQ